jgi:hypothetical protein
MEEAIIGLLFDLHAFNMLNINIINSISKNFGVDAEELCEANGITYDIE